MECDTFKKTIEINQNIEKYIFIGKEHLTDKDCELLDDYKSVNEEFACLSIEVSERLYIIGIWNYDADPDSEYLEYGFSEQFIEIIHIAHSLGCTTVIFSEYGETLNEFKNYWE